MCPSSWLWGDTNHILYVRSPTTNRNKMYNMQYINDHVVKIACYSIGELPTQQKHDRFPFWHFFQCSSHLHIAWIMNVWVDIRVCSMFTYIWLQMNELGGVNVGK